MGQWDKVSFNAYNHCIIPCSSDYAMSKFIQRQQGRANENSSIAQVLKNSHCCGCKQKSYDWSQLILMI